MDCPSCGAHQLQNCDCTPEEIAAAEDHDREATPSPSERAIDRLVEPDESSPAFRIAQLEAQVKAAHDRIDTLSGEITKLAAQRRALEDERALSNRAWTDVRDEAAKLRFLAVVAGDAVPDAPGRGLGLLLAPIANSLRRCADVGQGCIQSPRS